MKQNRKRAVGCCQAALFLGKGCAQVGKNLRIEKWDVRVICLTRGTQGNVPIEGWSTGENVGEDVSYSLLTSVLYHIIFENFVTQVTQYKKRYIKNEKSRKDFGSQRTIAFLEKFSEISQIRLSVRASCIAF